MRIALTGGASGIGAAIAARLVRDGHEVTAFDIAKPQEEAAHWIETDLADPESVAAAIAATRGPYEALINNAGLPPREGQAELILRVNFFGFRQFLEGMLDSLAPEASIVNTASRAGAMWRDSIDEVKALMALRAHGDAAEFVAQRNIDHVRAYNLSKEAVIVLTIAEAERMIARGLRMNCVSPPPSAPESSMTSSRRSASALHATSPGRDGRAWPRRSPTSSPFSQDPKAAG